jgi:hypothetical protein
MIIGHEIPKTREAHPESKKTQQKNDSHPNAHPKHQQASQHPPNAAIYAIYEPKPPAVTNPANEKKSSRISQATVVFRNKTINY